jgi:hypothetical protein
MRAARLWRGSDRCSGAQLGKCSDPRALLLPMPPRSTARRGSASSLRIDRGMGVRAQASAEPAQASFTRNLRRLIG